MEGYNLNLILVHLNSYVNKCLVSAFCNQCQVPYQSLPRGLLVICSCQKLTKNVVKFKQRAFYSPIIFKGQKCKVNVPGRSLFKVSHEAVSKLLCRVGMILRLNEDVESALKFTLSVGGPSVPYQPQTMLKLLTI